MEKRSKFIPFSQHWFGEEEEQAVLDVLHSSWVTTGPVTGEFEKEFADYVGAPCAVGVTSCTAGLFMVYQALGVNAGDEVVVPAITWPATANAAAILGARVVFADVDYNTMCVTRDSIAHCLSDRTKVVAIVHFAGLACDLDSIVKLCRERGITLIEDAAHAVGTKYKNVHVGGAYSAAAVYSFHPIKNMTTAEGGMITCHDRELYRKLNLYKFHGISRDAWKAYRGGTVPLYDLEFPALKFNLTDIQSAIGRAQLKKVAEFNTRRKQISMRYLDELSGIDSLDLPAAREGHAWHLFVVKINERAVISREKFILMLRECNIGAGIHFLPVNGLSYYRQEGKTDTPVAEKVGNTCVSLPLHPLMSDSDVEYVITSIKRMDLD